MSTDTAKTYAHAKRVLDELQKRPAVLWALHTMLPSVRVAGPWTQHPKGGVHRPTPSGGTAVHIAPIPGSDRGGDGPMVYAVEYGSGGLTRSADDYDTLITNADKTLLAQGWALVPSDP